MTTVSSGRQEVCSHGRNGGLKRKKKKRKPSWGQLIIWYSCSCQLKNGYPNKFSLFYLKSYMYLNFNIFFSPKLFYDILRWILLKEVLSWILLRIVSFMFFLERISEITSTSYIFSFVLAHVQMNSCLIHNYKQRCTFVHISVCVCLCMFVCINIVFTHNAPAFIGIKNWRSYTY